VASSLTSLARTERGRGLEKEKHPEIYCSTFATTTDRPGHLDKGQEEMMIDPTVQEERRDALNAFSYKPRSKEVSGMHRTLSSYTTRKKAEKRGKERLRR